MSYEIVGNKRQYILDKSEEEEFKKFYTNNLKCIKEYEFALEYLNNIANIKLEFRIPILFMIIESFFCIEKGISYKISLFCTRLLNKDENFKDIMKSFYKLRSKISHGDKKGIQETLRKIKDMKYISEEIIEEAYKRLYKIMIDIWKKRMSYDLKTFEKLTQELEKTK